MKLSYSLPETHALIRELFRLPDGASFDFEDSLCVTIRVPLIDVRSLVRARYGLPDDTEIVTETGENIADTLKRALASGNCFLPNSDIAPHMKIAAIKIIRNFIPNCGLAQAKHAIEDWSNFFAFVKQSGFPPMGSSDPDHGWKK